MTETSPTAVAAPTAASPSTAARLCAEAFGTFLLVFGVAGAAIFAAGFNEGKGGLNIGFLGVSLALGLTVVVGAYAFAPISGAHFNPAVTLGLAAAGKFAWGEVVGYLVAQVVGGIVASSALWAILAGGKATNLTQQFAGASNGYGQLSPGGFGIASVFLVEIITTAFFLYVILGVTHERAAAGFAPLAIGLTLTLMALVAIPVSNASFNPARTIATAIYGGPVALGQMWVCIVAPIVGGMIAGFTFRLLFDGVKKA